MCESCKKPFYITTPIYYPSSNLHIGHAYCSTAADSMARFKKLTGYDVYFLTGTDEHGQKIERKAKEQGVTPKEYVDKIVAGIKDLWKLMDIDYSDFIRTTDDRHVKCVQKIFKQLYDQGDIYKSEYEGWYCTPCESFWTELQLKDGCCPDCGRPVEKTREESYFFRLQKYAEWLIQYIEEHPDFIQPASRANEMLNNFLRPGLEDLCVSRTSIKWGIPVTFDEKHTVYVWIDALSNYISALGYGTDNDALFQKYWPARWGCRCPSRCLATAGWSSMARRWARASATSLTRSCCATAIPPTLCAISLCAKCPSARTASSRSKPC